MSKYEYTIGKELDLKKEQQRTFETPRIKPNFILIGMFITFDLVYGFKRTLPKFLVLEILARYPYWAWEAGACHRLTKLYSRTTNAPKEKVEKLLRHIELGRHSQDNEQFHMALLMDIIHQKGIKLSWWRHFLVPAVLTRTYYFLTKIMYFMNPVWSFAMNAAFESHAENQYMLLAKENPQWDDEEVNSEFFKYYPRQKTLGDLIRRIGLDERDHMHESMEEIGW